MTFRRWYRRNRTLFVSLMACASFLALAIYGWEVEWEDVAQGFLLAAVLLLGLMTAAAILGFVLFKWRRFRERGRPDVLRPSDREGDR
ncbi:hypothetical protein [Marinimicrobium sp. C2-29]|uniref:hypothetical protein n=1 Tax=Marinimicrobium sp. C2-29 TaxID=3139825 RepID=UPI003139F29D